MDRMHLSIVSFSFLAIITTLTNGNLLSLIIGLKVLA
jgi:hypothetical protein